MMEGTSPASESSVGSLHRRVRPEISVHGGLRELTAEVGQQRVIAIGFTAGRDHLGGVRFRVVARLVAEGPRLI
jgi:hypothetical protein